MEEFLAGKYDIAVIGAGHAGCEAALASARLGFKTVIFTLNLDSIANMPCNPRIGGTSKGHLVREIDALGGEMGKVGDRTYVQSRMLNKAKGPAVYSLRVQIDRRQYQTEMKKILEKTPNLDVRQAEIADIMMESAQSMDAGQNTESAQGIENKKVKGVKTTTGAVYECQCAIVTTGTYLSSKIIIGQVNYNGGPDGFFPADKLSKCFIDNGIELYRFKTGTPARVNRNSIDFSRMEEQKGDEKVYPFSFENKELDLPQESCWLTYTTEETHEIIRENLHRSPLYSGMIEGVGARYCPSIEDKIVRFPDRSAHQVFVEPCGRDTDEMYVQGMSSSLPEDVQAKVLRSLPGFENVSIMRTGYAIEYDCINPIQLKNSLEHKKIHGLFFAGQVNGSSGYEEAAAQGLLAGINASCKISEKESLVLSRSDAYIGVLIDDLVTKGTNEPYRMMTSRAEYRLLLRQDNADMRLTQIGRNIGLISDKRYEEFLDKKKKMQDEIKRLETTSVTPSEEILDFLERHSSAGIVTGIKLIELLKRTEIKYNDFKEINKENKDIDEDLAEQIEIEVKYSGYIKRQRQEVEKFLKLEKKKLPPDIHYSDVRGLRTEAVQKLTALRPASIGQASRISGVSPADISVLVIYLEQYNLK